MKSATQRRFGASGLKSRSTRSGDRGCRRQRGWCGAWTRSGRLPSPAHASAARRCSGRRRGPGRAGGSTSCVSRACDEPAGLGCLHAGPASARRSRRRASSPLRRRLAGPLVVGGRADLDAVLGEHGAHGLDTPTQPGPPSGPGTLWSLCSVMNAITVSRAGRARPRRKPRRLSRSRSPGAAQRSPACSFVISAGLLAGHARALPGIDLGAPDPDPQRLRRPDPEHARHRADRGPLRAVAAAGTSATIRTARSRSSSGYLLGRPILQSSKEGVSGLAGTAES